MAAVGYAYAQAVVAGRQIGKIGVVAGANLDPVLVKAFQLVGVANLFKLTVIQRGEGNPKSVLVVSDSDFRLLTEQAVYGTLVRRRYNLAVDGEQLKHQRHRPSGGRVQRIEPGDAVRAAKDQGAVRKDAGGALTELVPAYAVYGQIMDKGTHRAVILAQTGHGRNPNVALTVFFYGTDILAGRVGNGADSLAGFIQQQAGAHGPNPDVPVAVLEHAVGDEQGMLDTGLLFFLAERQRPALQRISVYHYWKLVETGSHQLPGLLHEQVRHKGPAAVRHQRNLLIGTVLLVVTDQGRSPAAYP